MIAQSQVLCCCCCVCSCVPFVYHLLILRSSTSDHRCLCFHLLALLDGAVSLSLFAHPIYENGMSMGEREDSSHDDVTTFLSNSRSPHSRLPVRPWLLRFLGMVFPALWIRTLPPLFFFFSILPFSPCLSTRLPSGPTTSTPRPVLDTSRYILSCWVAVALIAP